LIDDDGDDDDDDAATIADEKDGTAPVDAVATALCADIAVYILSISIEIPKSMMMGDPDFVTIILLSFRSK